MRLAPKPHASVFRLNLETCWAGGLNLRRRARVVVLLANDQHRARSTACDAVGHRTNRKALVTATAVGAYDDHIGLDVHRQLQYLLPRASHGHMGGKGPHEGFSSGCRPRLELGAGELRNLVRGAVRVGLRPRSSHMGRMSSTTCTR